jgi:hypothetical protein
MDCGTIGGDQMGIHLEPFARFWIGLGHPGDSKSDQGKMNDGER